MPPPTCSDRIETVTFAGATQATFAIGYPTVPASHPDTTVLDVLAAILAPRLNAQRQHALGSTWHVSSYPVSMQRAGFYEIVGAADPARTAEVLATISAQVESLRLLPASNAELDVAKKQVSDRGVDLAFAAALDLPSEVIVSRSERIRSLTADDARAVAARYFEPQRRCVVVVTDGKR